MTLFFTADEHHDHEALIGYVQRPFKNKKEMMKEIIGRYNDTVTENDTVWHIGDVSMLGSSRVHFFETLAKKYRKVKSRHLVLGNHDDLRPFTYVNIGLFTTVHTAFWMNVGGHELFLAHDPALYQPAMQHTIMLCGHIHRLYRTIPIEKLVNVGVDVWDFAPVSLERVIELLRSEGKL